MKRIDDLYRRWGRRAEVEALRQLHDAISDCLEKVSIN